MYLTFFPHPTMSLQLQDFQEKYAECGAMLHEAQEEIKNLRNRSLPNSTINRHSSPTFLPLVRIKQLEGPG